MSTLTTLDPYLPHYVYEKQRNPKADLVWKKFQKKHVDAVDRIVELARGNRDKVKGQKDWDIVEEIVNLFANTWKEEFDQFKATIPDIRSTRRAGGYSASREIKYIGAMPGRLIKLIKAIFPDQQFDKSFMDKFIKKFPLFMVGGSSNLGKGRIII